MFSLCVAALQIGLAVSQQSQPGATPPPLPPPPPQCAPPSMPKVTPLSGKNTTGTFPRAEYNKLMKNRKVARDVKDKASRSAYCSRLSPRSSDQVDPMVPQLKNVCPATNERFYIPRIVYYERIKEYCWVLPHWRHSYCTYTTCRFVRCRFVATKGKEGPQHPPDSPSPPPPARCLQSNWRRIYYYIICPNPWKLYSRSFILPQSCSCQVC